MSAAGRQEARYGSSHDERRLLTPDEPMPLDRRSSDIDAERGESKVRRAVTCSAIVVALLIAMAPAAQAVVKHRYRGRTSAGGGVKVVTTGRSSGLRIKIVGIS